MIPAWLPVKEADSTPTVLRAMLTSAMEIRSPAVKQHVHFAGRTVRRDLVGQKNEIVGELAHRRDDDHDLVRLRRRVRATCWATARMRSALPTDVPPNFCTMSAMRNKDS